MTDNSHSTQFILQSGFVVAVKPLPPYYLDFINEELPLPDLPMRKLTLKSGDVVDFEYIVPDAAPDVTDVDEFELYMLHKQAIRKRNEVNDIRNKMRQDYLLSTCVDILEGPVDINSDEWIKRIQAALPSYVVPPEPYKRRLAFIKAVVITTLDEQNNILNASIFPEVTMQSITNALQGFQVSLGRQKSD